MKPARAVVAGGVPLVGLPADLPSTGLAHSLKLSAVLPPRQRAMTHEARDPIEETIERLPADTARSHSHLTAMHMFTIGYEGATQRELITALRAAGVQLLADIRAVPLSRRPGFSKNILAAGLREDGIDYVGLKALGTPPEGREAARRGDHATLARIYAGQLELPEAMMQGAQLRDLAEERSIALLCFERDPQGCHRSLLIEAIMPDATVTHLFA